MHFVLLPFPFFHNLHPVSQTALLLAIANACYLQKRVRAPVYALFGLGIAWYTVRPLAGYAFIAFKALAMFGFYVHFFLIAIRYISLTVYALLDQVGFWDAQSGDGDRG